MRSVAMEKGALKGFMVVDAEKRLWGVPHGTESLYLSNPNLTMLSFCGELECGQELTTPAWYKAVIPTVETSVTVCVFPTDAADVE